MNPTSHDTHLMHDLAKQQAQGLRDAAIGDFWRGADAVLAGTRRKTSRSAERLGHALARRLARTATTNTSSTLEG